MRDGHGVAYAPPGRPFLVRPPSSAHLASHRDCSSPVFSHGSPSCCTHLTLTSNAPTSETIERCMTNATFHVARLLRGTDIRNCIESGPCSERFDRMRDSTRDRAPWSGLVGCWTARPQRTTRGSLPTPENSHISIPRLPHTWMAPERARGSSLWRPMCWTSEERSLRQL